METAQEPCKNISDSDFKPDDISFIRSALKIDASVGDSEVIARYRAHIVSVPKPSPVRAVPAKVAPVLRAESREEIEQRQERRRRQEEEDAANLRAVRRELLFRAAKCPARHSENEGLIDADACSAWIEMRQRVSKQIRRDSGALIALLGGRGTGKTQAAVSIIRRACERGLSCRYAKAIDLSLEIRATYSKASQTTELAVMQEWAGFDLLVLDEAHQRSATPAEQNALTLLIDRRYDAKRNTILIANQSKEEFAAAIGDSIVSRIHECGSAIVCDWPSFRKPATA